ncbi:MAG TPA: N,N-dimethylformamidase beta subunit family domain-containing protein [Alphaproteobacteria bacterium]|nr:N,N-dimethylformamidase beta subunit family domain-containing protein [Alphaproteobacteria bacterium]
MTTPRIIGYADQIGAAPGDRLRFMVSCEGIDRYRADIVRIVAGVGQTKDPADQYRTVETTVDGLYPGRFQPIHSGSFAVVENCDVFASSNRGFSVQALIWPTLSSRACQALLSQWCDEERAGFALVLDGQGALALMLGRADGSVEVVSTGVPVVERVWHFVGASFETASGEVNLYQEPLAGSAHITPASVAKSATGLLPARPAAVPLLIAAACRNNSRPLVGLWHFNGKIEAPRIAGRALTRSEMEALRAPNVPSSLAPELIAAWDFSEDIETDRIRDRSPNRLDGRLVNLPARAMTGHNWTGTEMNWSHARDQYGAIHFHEDDLYDAAWEPDFTLTLPRELRSGVYAARLQAGDEAEHIPFFVTRPRGEPSTDLVFLAPTASYMAYANERAGIDAASTEVLTGHLTALSPRDLWLNAHREAGYSLYDRHADSSGVCYSSRLRPIMNLRCDHIQSWSQFPWQFSADMHIIGWLEAAGHRYDVTTDEELHRHGLAALAPYRVVITGTHPEYYSTAMWDAVRAYLGEGGRLIYLGGNGFYWRIAYHRQLPGVIELRRAEDGIRDWTAEPGEYYHSFNGEYGGLWRRLGRPPQLLVGVGMAGQGFDVCSYFRRQAGADDPRAAFIFKGIEDEIIGDFGLIGGGAAGIELDRYDLGLGTPSHALVLARSEAHTQMYFPGPEEVDNVMSNLDAAQNPLVRADMIFFETGSGGAVFSTGSIAWSGSLSHNNFDNNVARITANLLQRFRDPAPFPSPCG